MSIALLLVLVCVVVSAVVLAAATASAGRFAELGKADQRYYSVTSAAKLFEDSLGDGDALELKFVQERTLTDDNVRGDSDNPKASGVSLNLDDKDFDATKHWLESNNILAKLTYLALFGSEYGEPVSNTNDWRSFSDTPIQLKVQPSSTGALNEHRDDLAVMAVGSLQRVGDDNYSLVLDLDFFNGDKETDEFNADSSHMHLVLAADCSEDTYTLSNLETTKVVSGVVANEQRTTEKRITTVTWHLQEITAGR